MTPLHPALQKLSDEYDQLVAGAEAGHIEHADALAALSGMSVTDAAGAAWAINADGNFVRAPFPGAPAQPSDPAYFATTATAPTPNFPGAPVIQQPAATPGPLPTVGGPAPTHPAQSPPVPLAPSPGPVPQQFAAPTPWQPATVPAPAQPSVYTPPPTPGMPSASTPLHMPTHTAAAPVEPDPEQVKKARRHTRSLAKTEGPRRGDQVAQRLRDFASRNRVLLGILMAGVAVMVGMNFMSDRTATNLPSAAPTSAAQQDSDQSEQLDAEQMPTEQSALPSKAQASDIIDTLGSGRVELVAAAAADAGDQATTVKAAALWAGAKELGLSITPGAAAADGDGAVQTWSIENGRTHVADVSVTWVRTDQGWTLKELPLF